MIEKICLCGSTKFKDEFAKVNKKLTLEGYVVLSVGVFYHDLKDEITDEQKLILDKIHKKKIDLCDAIYVINPNQYIGKSTKNEIEYAKKQNKEIFYYELSNHA